MKVLLLIRSLNVGGAERQLLLLARQLGLRGHAVTVVTFYAEFVLAPDAAPESNIRFIHLNKRSRWDVFGFCVSLWRVIRTEAPAVVYSFLTVANLVALIARIGPRRPRIVWGVRASAMNAAEYGWFVSLTLALERRLSRLADLIIFNSRTAMAAAVASGFAAHRCRVIPNGIDTSAFYRDESAGAAMRRRWQVGEADKLVGIVARLDPMKGHRIFLQAVATLSDESIRFVCVGNGDAQFRSSLEDCAKQLGIAHRLVWSPRELDLNGVYGALDVLCLPSVFGEGFPNVVGEAMACEVACVVTDVGDSGLIVNSLGWVVPPHDHAALASAIGKALQSPKRPERRERIETYYSVANLVDATERELRAVSLREGRHAE